MRVNRKRIQWGILLAGVLIFGWWLGKGREVSLLGDIARLDQRVSAVLRKQGVTETSLLSRESQERTIGGKRLLSMRREYLVGSEVSLDRLGSLLFEVTKGSSLQLLQNDWMRGPSENEFDFAAGWEGQPVYSLRILQRVSSVRAAAVPEVVIPLVDPHAPQVAFVLDDWGYNLNNLPALKEIDVPMTLAILPHLRFSSQIAGSLVGRNYEIILHMPMEAHNGKIRPEENTVYVLMEEEEIRAKLKEAIQNIPYLKGISNHMGSRFTEDPEALRIVMEELRGAKLYFLDSLVTSQSVAQEVSHQTGVPFAKRSVFLDNRLDHEYIREQIVKLADQAKRTGRAIGIGHDRALTLQVIREMIPRLKEEGILFVYVSQLTE